MTALVVGETLLLVLVVLLLAGLLRSHAEILRRLGPPETGGSSVEPVLPSPARRAGGRPARDLAGTTLGGDARQVGLSEQAPPTLLAFLSSGCSVCDQFWSDLRSGGDRMPLEPGLRLIALTKDTSHESPSRLERLAGGTVPVLMSSAAWSDYRVPAAPYFVYIEGGQILGEGSANGWTQIGSLLRDALSDRRNHGARRGNGDRRTDEIDGALAAAGIGPGHPSLYPAGRSSQTGNAGGAKDEPGGDREPEARRS